MTTNVKKEFEEHSKETGKSVKAASITAWRGNTFNLKVGYTTKDYEHFLRSINFEYNAGYGGQEVEGCIWYVGGTWSSRGEYDGSEWWEYNSCPKIPRELKE
jgi:hypothetical protein